MFELNEIFLTGIYFITTLPGFRMQHAAFQFRYYARRKTIKIASLGKKQVFQDILTSVLDISQVDQMPDLARFINHVGRIILNCTDVVDFKRNIYYPTK